MECRVCGLETKGIFCDRRCRMIFEEITSSVLHRLIDESLADAFDAVQELAKKDALGSEEV